MVPCQYSFRTGKLCFHALGRPIRCRPPVFSGSAGIDSLGSILRESICQVNLGKFPGILDIICPVNHPERTFTMYLNEEINSISLSISCVWLIWIVSVLPFLLRSTVVDILGKVPSIFAPLSEVESRLPVQSTIAGQTIRSAQEISVQVPVVVDSRDRLVVNCNYWFLVNSTSIRSLGALWAAQIPCIFYSEI